MRAQSFHCCQLGGTENQKPRTLMSSVNTRLIVAQHYNLTKIDYTPAHRCAINQPTKYICIYKYSLRNSDDDKITRLTIAITRSITNILYTRHSEYLMVITTDIITHAFKAKFFLYRLIKRYKKKKKTSKKSRGKKAWDLIDKIQRNIHKIND